MRIKCISCPPGSPAGYNLNEVLLVVAIELYHRGVSFRVVRNINDTPYLVDFKYFHIISNVSPSNWIIYFFNEKVVEITAKSWAREDFWISYYDGESWAEKLYDEEVTIMLAEDPII